jgi:hypothetical protein
LFLNENTNKTQSVKKDIPTQERGNENIFHPKYNLGLRRIHHPNIPSFHYSIFPFFRHSNMGLFPFFSKVAEEPSCPTATFHTIPIFYYSIIPG